MMLRCLSFRNTFSTMVPGVRHGFSGVREKGNASVHGFLQNRTWTWPGRDWHLGPHLLSKASPCPLAWIGPCGQNLFKNMFDYYSHPKPCKFASKADPAGGAAGESTPVPYRYDVGIADQGKTNCFKPNPLANMEASNHKPASFGAVYLGQMGRVIKNKNASLLWEDSRTS